MTKEQLIQFKSDLDLARRAEQAVLDHVLKIWDNFSEVPTQEAPPTAPAHPLAEQLKATMEAKEDPLAESQITTGGIVKPTPTRKPGSKRASSPRAGSGAERVREWADEQVTPFTMRDAKRALGLSHSTVTCAFLRLLKEGVLKRLDHGTYTRVPVVVVPPKEVASEYAKFRDGLGELKVPSAGSLCPESRGEA